MFEKILKILYWVKIIALICIPFLLWGIIYYTKKLKIFSKKIEQIKAWFGINDVYETPSKTKKQWEIIDELLLENYSSSWKLAVLKADALIENLLKQIGFKGDTLDELINSLKLKGFKNLEILSGAHEVSKEILTNRDYNISQKEARNIVEIYKKFWQEIIDQISLL
ncbi:MAG: hypothetical protein ACPLW7_04360 [Minisyncoccia bacterium]